MGFTFNITKQDALSAILDTGTLKMLIVMADSTVDSAGTEDYLVIDSITQLDEFDGTGYIRKIPATPTVTTDNVNNRAELTFETVTWTNLGAGSKNMKGVLIYTDPSGLDDDSTNIPRWFITEGFPTNATGINWVFEPNADGVIWLP